MEYGVVSFEDLTRYSTWSAKEVLYLQKAEKEAGKALTDAEIQQLLNQFREENSLS